MASPPVQRPESDTALMARVAAREPSAQEALIRRLAARVRRLSRWLLRSSAEADDAAQTALIEILRSADGFREEASLERWADRITVRAALRAQRSERRRLGLMRRWWVPGSLPWGSWLVTATHEPIGLEGLLERLAPERREALVLRHALGYSTEEIAELTGAPVGTVKDRLVAARKQVRRLLEREHGRGRGGGHA